MSFLSTASLETFPTYTDQGVGIAFLDTGISAMADFSRPNNRIVAFRDFIAGRTQPYDDNGHGTHVAGIASGNGTLSNGKFSGIAPKSHIISIKILDKYGQGNSPHAISAIRWIMDNSAKYNIKIVNLSIGTNDRKINLPLKEAVESLWKHGIIVIAAAGNPNGKKPFFPPPSISPHIITVGSWEDKCYFTPPRSFSIFTKEESYLPDIWAPGEQIISVMSPNYSFALPNRDRRNIIGTHYIRMSGASMATPLVSGSAALLLERFPRAKPNEIKQLLLRMANNNGGFLARSAFEKPVLP